MVQWAIRKRGDGRGSGRLVWHRVVEIRHFHVEYKTGRVDDGDEVVTVCHPGGYNLLDNMTVSEIDHMPEPFCKTCVLKNRERE